MSKTIKTGVPIFPAPVVDSEYVPYMSWELALPLKWRTEMLTAARFEQRVVHIGDRVFDNDRWPLLPIERWLLVYQAMMDRAVAFATDQGIKVQGFVENLIVYRYIAGQRADWHHDYGSTENDHSKVTVISQLNPSGEFSGGDLELLEEGVVSMRAGTVIAFPSWQAHRVTPLTRGTRYALVGWIAGPRWS